jgi:hypothetical protein
VRHNCRFVVSVFLFKRRLFQSSIEVEIIRCGSVSLEKTAFGKLKSALFKDISKFTLATETFEFKNQGSIGRHGPVTIVSILSVAYGLLLIVLHVLSPIMLIERI